MKPLQITAAAEAELREATAWYRDRDPRVSDRFAAEARRTLQLIEEFPQIGGRVPAVDDPAVRSLPIHTFPYHVVFVNLPDRIEVVAFAHNRRRPAYFIARLRR
ncbi:MAG TPA: type II toxin-antitoxin system RelE/ParE family toxin [Thermoanaerobaculia bacterium]|nr:type II toxin-antitoxin system RelE/ParE family toxin [Thermoanaerobaculia bacterium]